ncbi:glycosyltransferase [Fibrobacter sp. UWH1]|uniref:glycosyltransferase n=1 Tax=Fibrobacter sp. UWH1 TaxID=1964354 RepID=UPI000B5218FC|nr:glycosyltransferase [Fibrobacter sp. UWH1]OWV12142.1 UDP-galactose--lipooligosaccharide galactosyltransferase [Fibrobacter sp. UWH1]
MNTKSFSVAMCVYGKDNPEYFRLAVESILNQTVKPAEIVLVVDGPVPDDLNAVILGFEKLSEFKVFRFEKNQGHGVARSKCLELCSQELVALMDADDLSVPNRFELQLKKFDENSDLDIVGGNITEFIDDPSCVVGKRIVPTTDGNIKTYLRKRCPMNQMTVMFKKKSILKAGGYLDWFCNEDYYLWIRMYLANMNFANIPDNLVNVRVGKDMYQRRGGWKYFKSEVKLQWFMLKKDVISLPRFAYNIALRLVLQVLMPNRVRGFLFQKFARVKGV